MTDINSIVDNIVYRLAKITHFNVLGLFTKKLNIPLTVFLIISASIILTIALKFINFREIIPGIKMLLQKDNKSDKSGEISSTKSAIAIVAGSAGLGCIVGIPATVVIAGPGMVFWMLMAIFFVVPLRFAEVAIGHKYREKKEDGSFFTNPMLYLGKGFKDIGLSKIGIILGIVYSIFLLISGLGGSSSFQSNQVVEVIIAQFPRAQNYKFAISLCFTACVAIIITGGSKRILTFLTTMASLIVITYFSTILIVLVYNYTKIIPATKLILHEAFNVKKSTFGLIPGILLVISRVSMGTEIGTGTAPVMHANSNNEDSVREGIISMISPIAVTFFICFSTAFLIVVTGTYKSGRLGIVNLMNSFSTVNVHLNWIIFAMVIMMALSVTTAWSLYGKNNAISLFRSELGGKAYLLIYLGAVFTGGIIQNFDSIMALTDVVNTALIIPNAIGIIFLLPLLRKEYILYKKDNKK